MQNIINYQMSVFGDFMSYEPTLERMNALAKTPAEINLTLLPSTANVISLDCIISQPSEIAPPKVVQRIQMVDTGQKWNLVIMPDRIDVNFAQQSNDGAEQLDTVAPRAFSLMKHAITTVEANYWRIATNLAIQIDDESDGASVSKLHNALIKPLTHQVEKESVEWQIMSNCPQEVSVDTAQTEKLNVITIITRQLDLATDNLCIITQLDVSTSATNRAYRFDGIKLTNFHSAALKIIKDINKDIQEKWENE
jgi:hypothetical protein